MPRVAGPGLLAWQQLRSGQRTEPGAHGIHVADPGQSPAAPLPQTAVLLVPGGVRADGSRLGQAASYYDRLLARHAGVERGVVFACQRCDELPSAATTRGSTG